MDNLAFQIFDGSNSPVTGASLTFTTYKNQAGSNVTPVPITEIGNGWYSFESVFDSTNLGFAYLITTGHYPQVLTGFVRHEDFFIPGTSSPHQVVFGIVNNGSLSPSTGLSLSFSVYESVQGNIVTPPTIVELGGGMYYFIPDFTVYDGFVYTISTGNTYLPNVTYGYIRSEDFINVPNIPGVLPSGTTPIILPSTGQVDFGQDTYDLTDLPLVDTQVTGQQLVALRLARRLQTPYGYGVLYGDDPDMGYDIAQLLNSRFGRTDIMIAQVQIEQECLKDEQVQSVTCTINSSENGIYKIVINVVTADGPFLLTVPISGMTYKILFSNTGG